jgi:ligand-binding sensor domain-containing protein/signal transduction histidine kinase
LRSLHIFPDGWVFTVLALLCGVGNAYALDPAAPVSQYLRDRWTSEIGFPGGPVNALTQTPDGYLWVGTEAGLIRFDGVTFTLVREQDPTGAVVDHVLGLTVDSEGSLWVRLEGPTLLRYSGGVFQFVGQEAGTDPRVTVIGRAKNGGLLFSSRRNGLVSFSQSHFQTLAPAASLPNSPVTAMVEVADNDVWLGTRELGLVHVTGDRTIVVTKGLAEIAVNCLLPGENGELWVGTDRGLFKWDGRELVRPPAGAPLARSKILALLRDHDSNIWIGTEKQGLVRLNASGLAYLDPSGESTQAAVTTVFEDREGDIWAGGSNGIERLRNRAVVTYSMPQGQMNGPVYADSQGRVWLAPADGGLDRLSDGKIRPVEQSGVGNDVVYSIAGTGDELWVGRRRGGLTHLHLSGGSIKSETYSQKDGLAQDSVYAVALSHDGAVWAGTLNAGASRYRDGRFTTYTSADGLASDTVNAIVEGADGTIWFATPEGLSALSKSGWRTYTTRDGLPSEDITCLFRDSGGIIWAGTMRGIAWVQAGRISVSSAPPLSTGSQIFGIAEDKSGSLWVATANRLFRVTRARLLQGSLVDGDFREYGRSDGLGAVEGLKRDRALVADAGGRIWISMNRGVSAIDPTRQTRGSARTLVHIESISADGSLLDLKHPRIPPGTRKIAIDYAGLNLSAPERVRFRFNLDNFDSGWNPPTAGTVAVYPSLNPGTYRFHVTASNPDGEWNDEEAEVVLEVDPAFWQTWWFRVCFVTSCVLLIATMYRLRLNQLTRQFNIRFYERLTERNRIARELHDTLLQTIQGSKLLAESALDEEWEGSGDPVRTRRALEKIARWLEQAVEESRTALNSLRASTAESNDLAQAFERAAKECRDGTTMESAVSVEGTPRELHPIARDEVYRIGYEAIRNAYRHSGGSLLEVKLRYSRNFALYVRDNGKGIDAEIVANGKPTHFGLKGMAERAERAGGKLTILGSADSGTEVELIVPGHIVFRDPEAPDRWSRVKRLFGG